MKTTLITLSTLCLSLFISSSTLAEEINHEKMDHNKHMMQMEQGNEASTGAIVIPTAATAKYPTAQKNTTMAMTPLTEAGNAIFGTIQEAIKFLDANPNTDWTKVDIEALRQHLIDMENFTSGVEIVAQKDTDKGTEVIIKATSNAAQASLGRALAAHPSMLNSETGWNMVVKQVGDTYKLTIETDKPAERPRLRALGYIGVMALGNHHQVHHWLMASGANPHGGNMVH